MYRFLVIFIFLCYNSNLIACGFNFTGSCSSLIFLDINQTRDSFSVGNCEEGFAFNGKSFGAIRTLSLPKVNGNTWESCQNNVTAMTFFYRVVPSLGQPKGWNEIDMPQYKFMTEGPYQTRFREANPDINLLDSLEIGMEYELEVYYRLTVDTIGNDYIPETYFYRNNAGLNYKMSFIYGGPTAPPFVAIIDKQKNVDCAGDSTGIAGVKVYGDAENVRYQWIIENNFQTLYNIPAGVYQVQVNHNSGYSVTISIPINEKPKITLAVDHIIPLGCDGSPGSASPTVGGGSPPYNYVWSSGDSVSFAQFPFGGTHFLTVTDQLGCSIVDTFNVPSPVLLPVGVGVVSADLNCHNSLTSVSLSTTCAIPNAEFQWLDEVGWSADTSTTLYATTQLSATNLLHLFVTDNAGCKYQLPLEMNITTDTIAPVVLFPNPVIDCEGNHAGTLIVYGNNSPFSYNWSDTSLSDSPDFNLSVGNYAVTVTGNNGCTTAHNFNFEPAQLLSTAFPTGLIGNCDGFYSGNLLVNGGTSPYQYTWSDGADSSPQFQFRTHAEVSVTDAYGCSQAAAIILPTIDTIQFSMQSTPSTGANTANGAAHTIAQNQINGYKYQWSNGGNTVGIANLLPGNYCVTVTNTLNNCTKTACIQVDYLIKTYEISQENGFSISPNPAVDVLQIRFEKEDLSENLQFEIFDIIGKKLTNGVLSKERKINVNSLPAGIYVLKINQKLVRFQK
jgi:hypothetical protein